MDPSGRNAGLAETGEQTTKERGNLGSIQRGGMGVGAKTYSTCPDTQGQGSHYPPPASTPVNLILTNNVRRGRGGSGEDNISGK